MKPSELKALSIIAERAAADAAAFIRQHNEGDIVVDRKKGMSSEASSVVTWVDLQCQALILERLQESRERYDIGLLTEELPDDGSRLTREYFWCVDPLDGTLAFTARKPGYAVSIALIDRAGVPVIGVVHEPITRQYMVAVQGQGVRSTLQAPTEMSDTSDQLVCFLDQQMAVHPRYEALRTMLDTVAQEMHLSGVVYVSGSGAVLQACHVALHEHAVFFKIPKTQLGGGCIWDYAATACFFGELARPVSDLSGAPLHLNNPDTPFMNHCGVLYSSEQQITDHLIAFFESIH
ncbi:hypothetical protein BFP72_07410 [Reichenbachiella sp. 5M10]|nr:hypothetical protein BFP72_07410 [Reichenbachiella sp. 5M10]